MNAILNENDLRPAEMLAELIDRHGPWRVVLALAAQLARHRRARRQPPVPMLSAHLRRDIGLPELPLPDWDGRLHRAGVDPPLRR